MIKKRYKLASMLFIVQVAQVAAYEWPSADARIMMSFGQNNTELGNVQKGLLLQSRTPNISALDAGEVLFSQDATSILPSRSSGNVVIVHADSIYSSYTNVDIHADLSATNIRLSEESSLEEWMYQLYLYDNKVGQYVNPALFLPLGRSGSRVVLERLMVLDDTGREHNVFNGAVLPSGNVRFYLSSYSLTAEGRRLAPGEFVLQVLGNNLARVALSAIVEEDGSAYLAGNTPVLLKNLYNRQGMLYLATTQLREGQVNIVARVSNLDGEMQESTMRVRVVNLS
jgi:hypothetical protein